MSSQRKNTAKERLRKAGVRHFDRIIHDQPKAWLVENFKTRATKFPVNVTLLIRNIIWQTRERIMKGEREPMREIIRTFWYSHIKPTLARAGALSRQADQYDDLIQQLVFLVKEIDAMRYKDIGFRNDGQLHQRMGLHANLILFAEKVGQWEFISNMAERYQISAVALGGQPSVLNVEGLVDAIRETGINLKSSFYLFSMVDYDTSGWIIRDAFLDNLKFYGISHARTIDLIHPDMLTPEEIKHSRFRIPRSKGMRVKNKSWNQAVRRRHYNNQKYLEESRGGRKILYGLESEAISTKRLGEKLEGEIAPRLGQSEELLRNFELRNLNKKIKDLILHRILEPE